VSFLGAGSSPETLGRMVGKLLQCAAEEERVIDEISEAIDDQGLDWKAGTTSVSGLTKEEEETLCGDTSDHTTFSDSDHQKSDGLPTRVDWRDYQGENWMTPIRNQGRCGSCVAHAALGAFEAMLKIATGDPSMRANLSEQYLFFCGCGRCCEGGWQLGPAAESLLNRGVPEEECWRYSPRNASCTDTCAEGMAIEDQVVKATAIRKLTSTREMKESLVENGPILAGMDVYQDFLRYKGGVYKHAWGDLGGGHAITIVGYDDEERYWIARNSWGTGWGERGYFKIAYGAGIYNYAYELKAAPAATIEEPLVIGTVGSLETLDPAEAWSYSEWEILRNTMDTLVVYAPGSTDIDPGLAESWDVSSDALEYTFHLRKGLQFPDGTPFTSNAVVWSIQRVMDLGGGPAALITGFVDYVEAVDDYTMSFVLKEPDARFLSALTTPPYAPVSPNCLPEDEFDPESTCGGIGHYSVGDWTLGSYVELVANEDYYGDFPESPSVVVRYYGDSDSLRGALLDGEVDLAWDWHNSPAYADLLDDPNFEVFQGRSSYVRLLGFNTSKPPFDDALVRQAVEYAIDRQRIVEEAFGGVYWPLFSLVPDGVAFHSDDTRPYDPDQARAMLAAAGYGPGHPLEMELWWNVDYSGGTEEDLAQAVERSLEGTGAIEVDLMATDYADFVDFRKSGQLPVFLVRWGADYPDPYEFIWPLTSCDQSGDMGLFYCNGELEGLLRQDRQTIDPDEREALYAEMQDLLAEELPIIPLTQASLLVVAQPDVEGVVVDATGLLRYWLAWKEWFGGAPAPAPPAAAGAPKVTLAVVDGRPMVVVEGQVTEISFGGLEKLAPQPDADGQTRIEIPRVLPDDAGGLDFDFTFGGQRYRARIRVTYHPDGTVTQELLGVVEVAEPVEEPAAEPTGTSVAPTATPTLPPATATPTSIPPTATPTRVPPTATPLSSAPVILSVDFAEQIPADGTEVTGRIHFRDPGGDVSWAAFEVVSAERFDGFAFNPAQFLASGDAREGSFLFHLWCTRAQQVTLRARLRDAAGNQSAPVDFTFECR
jgi:peptide/nickel transport system substrate-binding protein